MCIRDSMASRNVPKVKRERFVDRIATTLAREYDHTTQKNLLFIRAQATNTKRSN